MLVDILDVLRDVQGCPGQLGQAWVNGSLHTAEVGYHELLKGLWDLLSDTGVLLQHHLQNGKVLF